VKDDNDTDAPPTKKQKAEQEVALWKDNQNQKYGAKGNFSHATATACRSVSQLPNETVSNALAVFLPVVPSWLLG